ncbi:MAG: type II secretion system F family protein [Candidatus Micrarchaeota archaeon]
MSFKRIYFTISALFPQNFNNAVNKKLIHAGIGEDVDIWIGRTALTTFLFSLAVLIASIVFFPILKIGISQLGRVALLEFIIIYSLPLFVIALFFIFALYYIYLFYRIQARTDAVEKVLPDFLLILISNLRAGMSPYSAFVGAARPEFGPLEEEIKKVAMRGSSSQSITSALGELSDRIDSKILQKTIVFFDKAMRSGGQMARILHASAEEIRHAQEMRAELFSQSMSYIIFLGFTIVLITPFLLSVSGQFLTMFLKIKESMITGAGASFNISLFQGELLISPVFIEYTGYVFLVIVSLFISFFIGSLMRGKPLFGIKYFPAFAVASIGMFIISRFMVSKLLASFG